MTQTAARAVSSIIRGVPRLLLIFASLLLFCASCSAPQHDADAVAQRLLDDSAPRDVRVALAREQVDDAADVLTAIARGMETGTEEEYRRIPWLWRVSRAAGESNDDRVIVDVLEVATPHEGEPLHDWQAVVIGGGIVSGLSGAGEWPKERIERILEDHPNLLSRYRRAIDLSAEMADDTSVPEPTRYDALRLVAMAGWGTASPQLMRYVDSHEHELQMGAVSGLADIRSPEVDSVLLGHFDDYTGRNRQLALEGLMRTDERASALLDAVDRGTVPPDSVGTDRIKRLREHSSAPIQRRARTLLPDK